MMGWNITYHVLFSGISLSNSFVSPWLFWLLRSFTFLRVHLCRQENAFLRLKSFVPSENERNTKKLCRHRSILVFFLFAPGITPFLWCSALDGESCNLLRGNIAFMKTMRHKHHQNEYIQNWSLEWFQFYGRVRKLVMSGHTVTIYHKKEGCIWVLMRKYFFGQ